MKISSDLMRAMIYLVRIPEITQVAQQLSKEMMKVKLLFNKFFQK